MTISLTHPFVSAKSDGGDATLVRPSNWNAEHTITMATARLLGRTTAAAGAVEEIIVGDGLTLTAGVLSGGMPRGYIDGLTLSNNGTDATNDIDIAAGAARDATNAFDLVLASALTKRLDAAWAVGTNQGGLDTGTIANGTYHLWSIKRSDTGVVDVLFSTSASAPTMPANYDQKRRIGSILRESAAIVGFIHAGDEFYRKTPILDVSATLGVSTAVTRTLSVPIGARVKALMNVGLSEDGSNLILAWYLSDLSITDVAASGTAAPLGTVSINGTAVATNVNVQAEVWTNTSGQIRSRASLADARVTGRISTLGWVDPRGKDA